MENWHSFSPANLNREPQLQKGLKGRKEHQVQQEPLAQQGLRLPGVHLRLLKLRPSGHLHQEALNHWSHPQNTMMCQDPGLARGREKDLHPEQKVRLAIVPRGQSFLLTSQQLLSL